MRVFFLAALWAAAAAAGAGAGAGVSADPSNDGGGACEDDGTVKAVLTATHYLGVDETLKKDSSMKQAQARFGAAASKDAVERARKALEGKKHAVHVVATPAAALAVLKGLVKDGMSISNGYSLTLDQIGYTDFLKSLDGAPERKITNFKGLAAKAQAQGKMDEYGKHIAAGAMADMFVSSVSAITEDGELYAADLTGSRINGWYTAKNLVVVAGSNKIVKDAAQATERLFQYQVKLEGARVRDVYKAPDTYANNVVGIRGNNPWGAPRVTVIIIEKSLGF